METISLKHEDYVLDEFEFERVLKMNEYSKQLAKVIQISEIKTNSAGEMDHMASETARQKVILIKNDGKQYEETFIVKRLPKNPIVKEMVQGGGFFGKEMKMYNEIFPAMDEVIINLLKQQNKNYKTSQIYLERFWPECISCLPNKHIILEDLKEAGYKIPSLNEKLDLQHSILAIQCLARMHALSVIINDKMLLSLPPFNYNFCNIMPENRRLLLKNTLQHLNQIVLSKWGAKWSQLGKFIIDNDDKIIDRYVEITLPGNSNYNVLCHGDPWTGNLLYRYCKHTGQPTEIKMIDYQISYFGSYALDLNFFLWTSVSLDVIKNDYQKLLSCYQKTLKDVFDQLNFKPKSDIPTIEEITKEMLARRLNGLFIFLYIAPRFFKITREKWTPEIAFSAEITNIISEVMTVDGYQKEIKSLLEPYLEQNSNILN